VQTGTSAPPLGRRVGRYELLAEIGRGGMGRVYCAQDVVLDRRVALKTLLRRDVSAIAEARIVREAQAMAQLAHPCVVPVYDVERTDDGLWIAMEYVPGCTLHRWLKQRRSTAEILAVFRDAGRGLEAAHAAGLVHRDFKPTNVLVGEDGRARVMDFGLARGDVAAETDPPGASSGSASPLVRDLTEQGTVLGTPSYMAPEQHRGLRADARADQYAFCTALFEALHGAHPFAAADRDAVQLVVAKHSSRFVAVGAAEVPPRIAAAIRRGLAPDPDARWPTMNDLLAELEPATRGRLRRWGLAAAALVLAGAGAFVVAGPDRARPSASVVATAPADRGPSLAAELAWLEGRLAVAEGDPNAARGRFELAWHTAFATGNDVLAARAAIDFLDVVGNTRGRTADALARAPEVESIVARVGDAALDARLERVMGSVLYGAGDTEGSQSRLHRAGVLLAGLADADPIELALVDDHVARNLHRNGAHDEARPLYDRSLERARAALGDGHPIVATILAHRSALAFDEGRFDEARAPRTFARGVRAWSEPRASGCGAALQQPRQPRAGRGSVRGRSHGVRTGARDLAGEVRRGRHRGRARARQPRERARRSRAL
jgi:hypothetical protein